MSCLGSIVSIIRHVYDELENELLFMVDREERNIEKQTHPPRTTGPQMLAGRNNGRRGRVSPCPDLCPPGRTIPRGTLRSSPETSLLACYRTCRTGRVTCRIFWRPVVRPESMEGRQTRHQPRSRTIDGRSYRRYCRVFTTRRESTFGK